MPTPTGKTVLACDRCRGRKQRCDGCRPSCSHCKAAGKECVYRPTPTNLESDAAVLSRLADTELRLQAIEQQLAERELTVVTSTHKLPGPLRTPPDLHTASACKMLRGWPRIRLCLTLADVDPTTYLATTDASDPLLLETAEEAPSLVLWQVAQLLEQFYNNMASLPVYIIFLFQIYPPLGRDAILEGLAELHPSTDGPNHGMVLDFQRLTIAQLDILTEVDGFPSNTILHLLESTLVRGPRHLADLTSDEEYIKSHFWLRNNLNTILSLYTPNKAYAQPHELADLVNDLSTELRDWYRSQPRARQFPRDATTFSMHIPSMSTRMKEIAVRYFSCIFLLNRPVLYFYLHKDMEYIVRPPDMQAALSDREPWILESCRDCIESAALIITICWVSSQDAAGRSYRSWLDYQLLFAAYLVLLQVKSVASLAPIFRTLGDIEGMLDSVESMFDASPTASCQIQRSLAILRNERHNFEISSPGQSAASV
ncbi:hypothetical protein GQ53DRAFT_817898 [Thozetella sp. PMI_491]|nr:hypothetical protein GQ53DRAFT_817898 [Thozetella sp. PMI_491]